MVTSVNPGNRGRLVLSLRQRAPLVLSAFLVGGLLGARLGSGSGAAQEQSEAGLLSVLSKSAGCTAERARWEPESGWALDLLVGRGILFECRGEAGNRDIFRAAVRLTPEGVLLGPTRVKNLTQTSGADESGLSVVGRRAAYLASASPLGVTLLEGRTRPTSFEASLRSLAETGTIFGYQKTHFHFGSEVESIRVSIEGAFARVETGSSPEGTKVDLGTLTSTRVIPGVRVEREPTPSSPFFHLSADLLRSAVGAEAVTALERHLFQARDLARRLLYHSTHSQTPPTLPPSPSVQAKSPGQKSANFPPTDPGLDWQPVEHSFLPRPGGAALAFLARVRPDQARPYVETELVEFDMRYLELGIRGGYMEPKPETGPPEGGHVPEDPKVFRRIVATLNGGFQSTHGQFGMKSDGRLLVQPSPGLATVRVNEAGLIELGTWTEADSAEDFVSFRQNLEPLFVGAVFDPNERGHFGDHLLLGGVFTERSALCVNERKNLVYAWSKDIDPRGLATSMQRAGCLYGIHLDMNPGHCSLTFHKVESFHPLRAKSALLNPQMKVNANRFLRWSPKDFFYLAVSSGAPKDSTLAWAAVSAGAGTETEVLYEASTQLGTEELTLFRTAPRVARYFVQPGLEEGGSGTDERPALFRLGLGHRTHGSRPGLAVGKKWLVPAHRGFATLEVSEEDTLRLHEPGAPVLGREETTFVQLPVLARDRVILERARARGDMRSRAALCQSRDGALLVAQGKSDSFSPIATALLREGCELVLEADRGSHFAGAAEAGPLTRAPSAETALFVLKGEPTTVVRSFTSP